MDRLGKGTNALIRTGFADIAARAVTEHGAAQKPAELAQFLELAADLKPEVVVEIGSYAGGTLFAWQYVASQVIGVDAAGIGFYGSINGSARREHGATMVIGDSHDPLTLQTLKAMLQGRPIDVLFIDGDHSYNGVKADHAMYGPLVRSGGLVAFHDIVEHSAEPSVEVDQYWREIRTDAAIEIVHPTEPPWGGIGVLHASGS